MRLGLLGYPISHSLSPKLYAKLLEKKLTSYELFSYESEVEIPDLTFFAERLDGLNITAPYKTHFMAEITVSSLVKEIGAVNTLAFTPEGVFGTNTDLLAVRTILQEMNSRSPLHIVLLGGGVMARLTKIVAKELSLSLVQHSRDRAGDITHLDLSNSGQEGKTTLIINACSRDFVFNGKVRGDEIFWDYNYSFIPHQSTLPSMVKTYIDGQEMLELQAFKAIEFWTEHNPKLK
jgi:shikimate dehydrogenase